MTGNQYSDNFDVKMSVCITPSYPYANGQGPTDVEYEFSAIKKRAVIHVPAKLGEPVLSDHHEDKIRYRFLWPGKPGAWSDHGVT